jgi:hypothetical protein
MHSITNVNSFTMGDRSAIRNASPATIFSATRLRSSAETSFSKSWGEHLWSSPSKVASIQYWLLFLGAIGLILTALLLFVRTVRKLKAAEKQLADLQAQPHRFQDDFDFDRRLGVYRHKTKAGFFCASCTTKAVESPLKEHPHGWACMIQGCKQWHGNPDHKAEPPMPRKSGWMDWRR